MGLTAALIGLTAVSAASSISAGQQQKKAYEMQAQQAELQAQAQITERTKALNEALANQRAMLGASGRTPESAMSVIEGDKKRYEQDINLIRVGGGAQAGQFKQAGGAAQTQSLFGAATTAGQGFLQYSMLKK